MKLALRRIGIAFILLQALSGAAFAQQDPLPSWRDGGVKRAIVAFVAAAVKPGDPGFIRVEDRIATFDNDGTLWAEHPPVQLQFILNDLAVMAKKDPQIALVPEVKAALGGELAMFTGPGGEDHLLKLFALTSSGMSPNTFADTVRKFFMRAIHPTLGVAYSRTRYQPMLELLSYLRANGFETWICTGGGVDFVRAISQDFYGISPRQVIGSSSVYAVTLTGGKVTVVKSASIAHVNDKEGKVTGLVTALGQPPVFAVGNEGGDGDIAHLAFSQTSAHPSLQIMINHDDAAREFAYAEKDGASLAAANADGWQVLSMKDDWLTIFSDR